MWPPRVSVITHVALITRVASSLCNPCIVVRRKLHRDTLSIGQPNTYRSVIVYTDKIVCICESMFGRAKEGVQQEAPSRGVAKDDNAEACRVHSLSAALLARESVNQTCGVLSAISLSQSTQNSVFTSNELKRERYT